MVHAEVALVEKMMSYGWFRDIYNAASSFYATIMGNDIDELDSWLDSYGKSPIKELRSFAYGIRMDLKAVRNAITFDASNGIVEGFVNKLKAVKRVMFGEHFLTCSNEKWSSATYASTKLRKNHQSQGRSSRGVTTHRACKKIIKT